MCILQYGKHEPIESMHAAFMYDLIYELMIGTRLVADVSRVAEMTLQALALVEILLV